MSKLKTIAQASSLIACAWLTACGTTIGLKSNPSTTGAVLSVSDQRQSSEKVYFRSSVTSPVQFFGDEDFSPAPVTHLAELVKARLPKGTHELHVLQFRVIDVFPQRMAAATSAALTGALGSMGYTAFFPDSSSVPMQDNITCLIEGRIDNRPVTQKVSVPYRISPLAGLIKNDPAFQASVHSCLDQLSARIGQAAQ